MIGTIINTVTILVGSTVGSLARRGIKKSYQDSMFTAMGLAALALGFNAVSRHMPDSRYPVLFIISLAAGGLIGTVLDLDGRFNRLVSHYSRSNLAQGLSTGILLYCIGTLSIVGPMMSALYGDNTYLFTNATLDLVTSAVLAATYGAGMLLAAPVLFCWQGAIYLITKLAGPVIPDELVTEVSIVGGILIAASGLNILKIKDCRTLNLLPALAMPILFFICKKLLGI